MDLLVEHLKKFIEIDQHYLVAYSGGLDSHVLLHLCAQYKIPLRAIYINHNLSPNASEWANHCRAICSELNIEFIEHLIPPINQSKGNLEEELRNHRYQIFKNILKENEILLTAHHQNDQAETILLQLFRGAGIPGLASMPKMKNFGLGFHGRPLLDFTRDDLLRYANHHQLKWIEDESNSNRELTRNFLRHDVMPLLTKRWPSITKTLARASENCADAKHFIDLSTELLLKKVAGKNPETLSVNKLLSLKEIEQRHVLRAWISQRNFLLPPTTKLQQILKTLLLAREDKMPHVSWGNVDIRRYRDDLFLMKKLESFDETQSFEWDLSQPLIVPSIGKLNAFKVDGPVAAIKKVTVRFRRKGESVRLPGRQHHHELKKIFQNWGVLPWLRNRIPLVYIDQRLAAIVGFKVFEEFGWNITLEPIAGSD